MKPLAAAARTRAVPWLAAPGLVLLFLIFTTRPATAAPAAQNAQCFGASVAADPSATVCISRVTTLLDGTSPNNQFYVSWRTVNAEIGQVKLIGGGTFGDVRGNSFRGATHYVKVNNLAAGAAYQFDIVSGGKSYNNGGSHWSANLGPALNPTTPYNIFSRVENPDGSAAEGALVYITVRDADNVDSQGRSSLLSAVIEEGDDTWFVDLQMARTRNNSAKFVFDPTKDEVVINVAGSAGRATATFKISDLNPPKPPPTLTLSALGTGAASTATPTLRPTVTPTEPPATATALASETPVNTEPSATPTPRPGPPTITPFVEPPLEITPGAGSVDEPPQESEVATEVAETQVAGTEVPGTTIEVNPAEPGGTAVAGQVPEPTRTRVLRGGTATPVAVDSNPFLSSNGLLSALALVLLVGAVLLGLAAFFVWRR